MTTAVAPTPGAPSPSPQPAIASANAVMNGGGGGAPPSLLPSSLPQRLVLPQSLDAFSRDRWTSLAREHGYEVIDLQTAGRTGECIVVLAPPPSSATPASSTTDASPSLETVIAQFYPSSLKQPTGVWFMSSVIFTSGESELGAFPASIEAYRRVAASVHICPTSLSSSAKRILTHCVHALGGKLDGVYQSRLTTHLVAAKALSDKYRAAVKFGRPVVNERWIEACFREGRLVPVDEFKVGCLLGATIACVGLTAEETETIREKVLAHGGQVKPYEPQVAATHVISGYPTPESVVESIVKGTFLVGRGWLDAHIEEPGTHVKESDWPVRSPSEEAAFREELRLKKEQAEAARLEQKRAAEAKEEQLRQMQAEAARKEQAEQQEREEAARAAAEEAAARARQVEEVEALRREMEVLFDPDNDSYLEGLQIFLLALDSQAQTEQLVKIIRYGGGTRLTSLFGRENPLQAAANANCSNMVLVYGSCRREQLDARVKAELHSRVRGVESIAFPIVNYRWLVECYRHKQVVPYTPYELPSPSSTGPTAASSTSGTNGLFSPRASSPALFNRTPSLAGRSTLLRTNSRITPAPFDTDTTIEATVLRNQTSENGPSNFANFNATLPSSNRPSSDLASRSAAQLATVVAASSTVPALRRNSSLPPPAPAIVASTPQPFQRLCFVLQYADPSVETDELVLLKPLRFDDNKRLTVHKQLCDHGANNNVFEPEHAWKRKDQIDFVIGSVCGKQTQSLHEFRAKYGEKALYASYTWVSACVKAGRILPIPYSPFAPNSCWSGDIPRVLTSTAPIDGFATLMISCSGFSSEECEILQACIEKAGAKWKAGFSAANTHLIYCDNYQRESVVPNPKQKTKKEEAFLRGVPVVRSDWLVECLNKRQLCDEKPFAIEPPPGTVVSLKRRATRSTASTAPSTPMMPDTPATDAPTPLPSSAFQPPPSTTKAKRPKVGESESKESDDAEGTIDSGIDEEEEDDDMGFGRALIGANAKANANAPLIGRSTRGRKSSAESATVSATTPHVSDITTPASPALAAEQPDASTGSHISAAKAAFKEQLKAAPAKTLGRRKTTLGAVAEGDSHVGDEGDDEGEAEYVPSPVTKGKPKASDTEDEKSSDVETASVGAFQKRKGGAPSSPAAIATLATAGTLVTPVLRTSPTGTPKKFVKQPTKSRAAAAAAAATAEATPTKAESSAEKQSEQTSSKESTPALSSKRVRRRIPMSTESDADATTDGAADAPNDVDEDEPGSQPGAASEPVSEETKVESTPKRGGRKTAAQKKKEEATAAAGGTIDDDTSEVLSMKPTPTRSSKRPSRAAAKKSTVVEESSDVEAEKEDEPATKKPPTRTPRQQAADKRAAAKKAEAEQKNEADAAAAAEDEAEKAESKADPPETAVDEPDPEGASSKKGKDKSRAKASESAAKVEVPATPKKVTSPTKAAPSSASSRASRSRNLPTPKSNAPLRSPSLGGGPEASLDHRPQRPRSKKSYGAIANDATSQEDPFAFNEDAGNEAKSKQGKEAPLAETQRLSPSTDAADEAKPAGALASVPQTADEQPAGESRSKRRAAVLRKSYREVEEDEEATVEEKEEAKPTKKAAPTTKSKRKQPTADDEAEADAPETKEVPTEAPSVTITPAKGKRKKMDVGEEPEAPAPEQPAASPIKRLLSLTAVESLAALSSSTPASKPDGESEGTGESEGGSPKKKARKESKASKKKSSTSPKDEAEAALMEIDETSPAESTSEKPSRKRKATTTAAEETPAKDEPKRRSASRSRQAKGEDAEQPDEGEEEAKEATSSPPKRAKKASKKGGKKKRKIGDDDEEEDEEEEFVPSPPASARTRKSSKKAEEEEEEEPTLEEEKPAPAPALKRSKKGGKTNAGSDSKLSKASKSSPKVFTLTGIPTADKTRLTDIITSLGGEIAPDGEVDYETVTHIISSEKLKRSEKVLVALMSNHFFLHPSYLDACQKAGKFVPESPYEWVNRSERKHEPMAKALARWHRGAEKPYEGWRVASVEMDAGKLSVFAKLLALGGGEFVKSAKATNVTHILVDTKGTRIDSHTELKQHSKSAFAGVQAILAAQPAPDRVIVARQEYLVEQLVSAGEPDDDALRIGWPTATTEPTPTRKSTAKSKTKAAAEEEEEYEHKSQQPADDEEERYAALGPDRTVNKSARRKRK